MRGRIVHGRPVSLLLPQSRACTVLGVQPVEIHGDRYVDVALRVDDAGPEPIRARLSAFDCPKDLVAGEQVTARFTMGVITKLERATAS
jgi:hypothetical protein